MARRTSRTRRAVLLCVKVAAVSFLVVFFLPPIRNRLLATVLPGAWLDFSSYRILQMLRDGQKFPFDSPFMEDNPSVSLYVDLADVKKFVYEKDPFAEFFHQRLLLNARSLKERELEEEVAMMNMFQPVMNVMERAQLMFTLDVFMKACHKYGLTYFIFEGALLGSYRHHGLVPWDDDIDIALNASQWLEVRKVLSSIPGFTLFSPPDSQWKFYLTNLPAFHDKPFKFPYLDLFFFVERGPYVWGLTWGMKNHLMALSKHVFPLTQVTWEMFQVPAPRCVRRMVESNYGLSTCVTPQYVHKTNERHNLFQTDKLHCSRLHAYLPFVFREERGGGRGVVESRRVGGRVLGNVTVPPPPPVCQD